MTDVIDGVRDRARATGLTERLKTALTALGLEDQRLTSHQLGALDPFHTRGLAATAAAAKSVGITADISVLVVGQPRASGPLPSLSLGAVMGPDVAPLAANLRRNLMAGGLGILTAVFDAAPIDG